MLFFLSLSSFQFDFFNGTILLFKSPITLWRQTLMKLTRGYWIWPGSVGVSVVSTVGTHSKPGERERMTSNLWVEVIVLARWEINSFSSWNVGLSEEMGPDHLWHPGWSKWTCQRMPFWEQRLKSMTYKVTCIGENSQERIPQHHSYCQWSKKHQTWWHMHDSRALLDSMKTKTRWNSSYAYVEYGLRGPLQ